MVNTGVPACVTLISLLAAEHDVSSVASPVSKPCYCVNCKSTPLTERLTDLLAAQKYYTIYHQEKVAKGHTNELHEKLEMVRKIPFSFFTFFTLYHLKCQYDLMSFSTCFLSFLEQWLGIVENAIYLRSSTDKPFAL